jgi:predicted enzyme related to lactoylglutathione lyase
LSPESEQEEEIVFMQSIRTFVYPVKELAQAKRLFSALLGVEPYVDSPYYVGYKVGDQDIGLDPNGHNAGMTGPVGYWHVNDIQQSLQLLLDAGAQTHQAVRDVGGGKLVATVTDADRNMIGLIQSP